MLFLSQTYSYVFLYFYVLFVSKCCKQFALGNEIGSFYFKRLPALILIFLCLVKEMHEWRKQSKNMKCHCECHDEYLQSSATENVHNLLLELHWDPSISGNQSYRAWKMEISKDKFVENQNLKGYEDIFNTSWVTAMQTMEKRTRKVLISHFWTITIDI